MTTDFTKKFNVAKKIKDELERGLNRLNSEHARQNEVLKNAIKERKGIKSESDALTKEYMALGSGTTKDQTNVYSDKKLGIEEQLDASNFKVHKARENFDASMGAHRLSFVNRAEPIYGCCLCPWGH